MIKIIKQNKTNKQIMNEEKSVGESSVNLITTLIINMKSFLIMHPIILSGSSIQQNQMIKSPILSGTSPCSSKQIKRVRWHDVTEQLGISTTLDQSSGKCCHLYLPSKSLSISIRQVILWSIHTCMVIFLSPSHNLLMKCGHGHIVHSPRRTTKYQSL